MIGKTISHYKILGKLGEGGMGAVYKAEDTKLQRTVALKFLPLELTRDENARNRFVHEARAASALDHPNIGTIHEIDEDDGQYFIAMAHYEGGTLGDKIEAGPLPIEEVFDIAIQVAQGLTKTHSKGIVHRDIKPANIMLTEEGQVKIVDFGVAKLGGGTRLTKTGMTAGTVAYMSPEQTQGISVDSRTDIWALGVILYEMLTGERPFKGDYEQAVVYSIVNEDPEFITKLRTDTPSGLEKFIDKALAKNADKRFQSMADMVSELQKLSEEQKSGELKTRSPLLKLGRKQRTNLYRAVAVFTVLAIVSGLYLWRVQFAEKKPPYLAILPLKSITDDSSQDWFTESMTEALITDLTIIGGFRVISRSSVLQYKETIKPMAEIARELGVDYIVDGSVVKIGDQVKITTRLIDAPKDEYIWAGEFERDFKNIMALQGEIAQAIAAQIQVKLTPQEKARLTKTRLVNPEALEAYLKGKFHWYKLNKPELEIAQQYFELALEKDPNFALAHAGIALVWSGRQSMGFVSGSEAAPKVVAAAEKALELDSTLAEVHYTLAVARAWSEWDWKSAGKAFRRAIALNPNYPDPRAYYSHLLNFLKRPDEAMEQIERALELDPLNSLFKAIYGMDLNYAHRYDDAIEMMNKTLKTAPNDLVVLSTLRAAYHNKQMYEEELEAWKRSNMAKSDLEANEALVSGYNKGGYQGAMLSVAEMLEKRSLSASTYVTPWQIGTLYTRAGKNDEALKWLEMALEAHDNNIPYISVDPLFDGLREHPRFRAMLRKMNLPE